MRLYHWSKDRNLKGFTKPHIYAWGSLEEAWRWGDLNGGGGIVIRFEVSKARKYSGYYLALTKNIINQ